MARAEDGSGRLPRGVTRLPIERSGRRYRVAIQRGRGVEVHLGLYETLALAALAYRLAAEALSRPAPEHHVAGAAPTAEQVRQIRSQVRRRLGMTASQDATRECPPTGEDLLRVVSSVVLPSLHDQVAEADTSRSPNEVVQAACRRLLETIETLFWCRSAGHPTVMEALAEALAQRLEFAFRRSDLIRALLDDDGDDAIRLARWLVLPSIWPSGRGRGFLEEVRSLYPECFDDQGEPTEPSDWAVVLGIEPPFSPEQVRRAFRARSLIEHPDTGGSPRGFIRLQAAYEAALRYCRPPYD